MALGAGGGEWEGGFEEDVGFVPVDVVVDDGRCRRLASREMSWMNLEDCQVRVTRMVLRSGPSVDEGDGVDVGDGRHVVEGAGVDVPGVVLLGRVFEGLELVAAGVGGEGFDVGSGSERDW